MSGFKDMVRADNSHVFMAEDEFAERRTVRIDGEVFPDIKVILSSVKEKKRNQPSADHVQGLYLVSAVLHCNIDDLGGRQPETGQRLQINDREGGGGFFQSYYVASSVCEMGMLRLELEAIDE